MTHTIRAFIAVALFATSLVFVTVANARPGHIGHGGGYGGPHGGLRGGHHGGFPGYYPGYPRAYPGYPTYPYYPQYPAYPGYAYNNGVICAAGNGYGYYWQALGYQYYDAAQNALQMCYMYSPYCQVISCFYR